MKKKIDISMIITTIICLLPMILSVLVYKQLPEQVAIHFNSVGIPDGFAPRAVAAFGLPLLMAVINLYTHFMLNKDPKKQNASITMQQFAKWLTPILTVVLIPITLFMSMGIAIPINIIAPSAVGVIVIACGNYLPKSKQNYTIGIKLPWTLSSETNWNKTHRLAGYVWIIGGCVILIGSLLRIDALPITLIVIILLVAIPFVYSYSLYKKANKSAE